MRPLTWLVSFLLLTLGGLAAFSLLRGQEGNPAKPAVPGQPSPPAADPQGTAPSTSPLLPANNKLAGMPPLKRHFYLSAQSGADWLVRNNRPDGRFDYGFEPALRMRLEGDHYLRQAGAVFALARAARYFKDDRQTAVARQAVLTLLVDTTTATVESSKTTMRYTALPSIAVNRLAAAGLIVLTINELPDPNDELLEQSEQLCAFIRQQQQADGALAFTDTPGDAQATLIDPEGINYYPGEALYGLMRSQQHRPAAWKTEMVRKALGYYRPWWQKNKNMAFVPWQTAAYAEAYLQTAEAPFADFVNEMNDWVCALQFTTLDPRHPFWVGGFMSYADGKPVQAAPQVGSAAYAEGLADACRVARKAADAARHQRYRDALERCLQFTVTLQYTDANTQHFADWYRPRLLGGFHASDQDGNLRIDFNQHAVCALVQYLNYVCEN
jgi:hypothetical protein